MFTIPNTITLANLFCGFIGIVQVLRGDATDGAMWVWIAAVLDFFDGFAARMLKSSSPIGKDLDSLADMVSFGILPSFVMFSMMENRGLMSLFESDYFPFLAFFLAGFSALRLAKFNNDTRQTDSFIGLPTPSNAFFITALPFIDLDILDNRYVLLAITLVFSFLLVSEIKMFSLKFKTFSIKDNLWKYLGLLISLVLIFILREAAIPIIILGYILVSIIIYSGGRSKQ